MPGVSHANFKTGAKALSHLRQKPETNHRSFWQRLVDEESRMLDRYDGGFGRSDRDREYDSACDRTLDQRHNDRDYLRDDFSSGDLMSRAIPDERRLQASSARLKRSADESQGGTIDPTPTARKPWLAAPSALPLTSLDPSTIVVIDGLNVCRSGGANLEFSSICSGHHDNVRKKRRPRSSFFGRSSPPICALALSHAIEYFLELGHRVSAFVPEWVIQSKGTHMPAMLDQYLQSHTLQLCPSGCDDDSMFLNYAREKVAHGQEMVVISNDRFKDHLTTGVITDAAWISKHCIRFCFKRSDCHGSIEFCPLRRVSGSSSEQIESAQNG